MMRRTIFATITALAMLMAIPAPAHANEAQVSLQTNKTAAIVEGDTAWVTLSWSARKGDANNFRITAEPRTDGVAVEYPENTADHSSLMDNDTLSDGEIDFTALKVTVPYGTTSVKLWVTATWTSDGRDESKRHNIIVPIARFSGDDLAQATDHAGSVAAAEPGWLGVEWTGVAPVLDDVTMTVSAPEGTAITYPAEGSSTSLHYDSRLEDGETDVARFLVDASAMTPGMHTLEVEVTYSRGGATGTATGTVTFEVTS